MTEPHDSHRRKELILINDLSPELEEELMRRARIKAAASDDHMARQAAAIAVLERLLTHFESTD